MVRRGKIFNPHPLAESLGFGSTPAMRRTAFSLLLFASVASASPVFAIAQNCGTIVVPPGVGLGPGADVTSFNPLFVTSEYNQEAINLIFEQLIWINRFHEIDWQRSIASAVTTPDQGKTYNVTLRTWHWSDGSLVTTADVLYAFKIIKVFGTNYAGYGVGGMPNIVQSLTATDATHFTLVLKRQVNPQWFILNGLAQLQPLPAAAWGNDTPDEIWQGQSSPAFFKVTDGPLLIHKLVVGVDAEFIPNPRYDGAAMHFNRFIMKFENSEGQELQAVQSHDLDMSNIPFDLYDKALTLPGNYVVTMPPTYSWHELIPNMLNAATPYFADVRVRDAMAAAIDQARIIGLAMHGHGIQDHGPVPTYPPVFLSPAAKAGADAGYDPMRARALLAQAGFVRGPDGVMVKDGRRFSFTLQIPAGQPLRIEIAEVIQQDLAAVGIDMKVRQVEFNQILTEMVNEPNNWAAILIAEDISAYPSGEDLFVKGGYLNNNGYSNPEMDRLVAQSTDAPGLGGLFAYEDFAAAQQPVIFLPNEQYSVLVRKGLYGVADFMNPLGNWAPEKLYCEAR
jgi:peptide/nickel transport system substrate-binding protein